ncbi:aliphatic sulfonate ABC transporter substrate-binding protein [Herbaspirillum sp. BH-1]|uniref:Sulfonate transport system substrate-binding protein n=1 Tax=Herbaspirillum frisingense TaxID=92645 RepID=A0ABU1PI41_9BURK|nr:MULTISPECIES: aliphatic sulfonate ABC transporter substrate-binding protein [Herbaspirillum]MDR6585013.1 sulfonate transport system substrate-binding protein [Herbaspirillum frisingense]PLY60868.1 aliphatic sulfonate ABC transporter substrate-binding protein [Herbaspirillum sp. BH-1]QNB05932.1 aliphatic sulfonate ABC transporter substrate-binding protein [Herbaspirillum frisingense]
MQRRHFLSLAPAALGASWLGAAPLLAHAAPPPKIIRLDYAYYSPPSLVLRKFGWLEEDLKAQGTEVKWVLSQGSNRALEYLNSDSIDFGSTAGLAALLARANGNPVKAIYVYSRPEWTALAVGKESSVKSLTELKGKKIAATKGSDPYLFLLRALHEHGLRKNDVEIVHLQHADGRTALEQGRVAAWAGLDPHLAASELEAGSRLIYRNVNFNTYGFLNVSDSFAARYPDQVKRVIAAYERARTWIIAHPDETVALLSEESKLSAQVARLQLKRNDFSHPQIGREHIEALRAAAPILLDEDLVKAGTDLPRTINALIDPSYAQGVVKA